MVDKDEVRENIVEASRIVFAKYGYRKTTMDEISTSYGKGKSSIYYYFNGKEDIYKAVIEKEASILNQTLLDVINSKLDVENKLRKYVQVRMETQITLTNYNGIQTTVNHLKEKDFIKKVKDENELNEISNIEGVLRNGVENGIFNIKETKLTALLFVASLKGLEAPLFQSGDSSSFHDRLDRLINVFFFGVMKR